MSNVQAKLFNGCLAWTNNNLEWSHIEVPKKLTEASCEAVMDYAGVQLELWNES